MMFGPPPRNISVGGHFTTLRLRCRLKIRKDWSQLNDSSVFGFRNLLAYSENEPNL
jgi:hypothetical protein